MAKKNKKKPHARELKLQRAAAYSQKDKQKNREEQATKAAAPEKPKPVAQIIREPVQQPEAENFPLDALPAPELHRITPEQSIQKQLAAYKNQGYEPTHKICSILAYMIGVDESFFRDKPHSNLEKGVFTRADQHKDLQLVRRLCALRNLVMRNCKEFSQSIYRSRRIQHLLPPGTLDILYRRFGKDLYLKDKIRTLGDYLLQINTEIRQAVDAVQSTTLHSFMPECVDPIFLAKLISFPDDLKDQAAAWALCSAYTTNSRRYPWKYYMNISLAYFEGRNPLSGDDEIVRYAYSSAGRDFHSLWQLRTPFPPKDSKETLHQFLDGTGHYTFCVLIDGTTVAVNEVLAILKELTPQELEMFETQQLGEGKSILLYCCNAVFQNWRLYLGEYEKYIQPIEVSSTVRDADRLEDISVNCALSTFWMPPTTAVVLVTRSPRVFRDCWGQAGADRRARCLITSCHASDAILDTVAKDGLPYAFLEDFNPQPLQNTMQAAKGIFQKEFPIETSLNLRTLLDEVLRQLPIDYTPEECEDLYQQLQNHLQLQVTPEGRVRLIYNGAEASA